MHQEHVIVLDLGTSRLRAHAVPVDRPWAVSAGAARPYVIRRKPGELACSFSPGALHRGIREAVRRAVAAAGLSPDAITGVAVTAQRGGAAFLDRDGNTLYAGPNKDLRAVFQGAEIDEAHGAALYACTGHLPSLLFPVAKLRWWQANRPREAARIARVLTLGAWAVHSLTGEVGETAPSLSEAALLDICASPPAPASSVLRSVGFDPSLVPPIVPLGQPIGAVTPGAAEACGLRPGTPVHLAGPDAQVALLGMGVTGHGGHGIVAGWSAPVLRVTRGPVFDSKRRTWTGVHLVGQSYVLEANSSDTGATVDMVRRLLRLSHGAFDAMAAGAASDAQPPVALLGPRALDLSSPGMSLGGLLVPAPITHDGLTPGAIARAVLENAAFALRECVDLLAEIDGPLSEESSIAIGGGMSAGDTFGRLCAAAMGRPVRRHAPTATATGAAIVASRPVHDWPQAAKEAASAAELVVADDRCILDAAEAYQRWRLLKARLDSLADEL